MLLVISVSIKQLTEKNRVQNRVEVFICREYSSQIEKMGYKKITADMKDN